MPTCIVFKAAQETRKFCNLSLPSYTAYRFFNCSAPMCHGLYYYYNKHKPVTDPERQDPDYFEKEAEKIPLSLILRYFKIDLNL